jgi:hypothetical protein
MTPDRKAILIFLTIFIVALGVAFGYRYQGEKADIAGIQAGQEWSGQSTGVPVVPLQQEVASNENDCWMGANAGEDGILYRKDGTKLCMVWLHEPSSIGDGDEHDPIHVTFVFSLISPNGTKQEIAKREEGYRYSEDREYIALSDRPLASMWHPVGWSPDEKLFYFKRSQGLPLDGGKTNVALDIWSLNIASGALKQVLKVGDLEDYWKGAYILDVDIPTQRVIVRKDDDVWVENFAGKTIVKLSAIPFELKKAETIVDDETYVFSQNASQIIVTARREVPYGSGKTVEYGPAVFDIGAGRYLK